MWLQDSRNDILITIEFTGLLSDLKGKHEHGLVLELVDSLDLKSSGIYSRGGSSPPEATRLVII